MTRTVYAASSGSYSDYSVSRLFATRELAEEFVRIANSSGHSDWFTEEFQLWDEMPQHFTIYSTRMNEAMSEPEVTESIVWDTPTEHTTGAWKETSYRTETFWARGPDRERCVKSVVDRSMAARATNPHSKET